MRLNLACGGQIVDGWVNVDRDFPPTFEIPDDRFLLVDLVADRWPWGRGSCEGAVLHHVLDLLTLAEMRVVLARAYGTLAPGAVLRMSNANLSRGVQAAIEGDIDWFAEKISDEGKFMLDDGVTRIVSLETTVGWFITQGGARKQSLTVMALQKACERAGFQQFGLAAHGATIGPDWIMDLDSRRNESWYAEAVR